jgi:transcriptional regulator with XRE-family HTH domain
MRRLRELCGLTQRDVARGTDKIVGENGDSRFHVSRSYLQDIELGKCMPSSCKVKALALVYMQDDQELFKLYGVTREESGKLFTFDPALSGLGSKPIIDPKVEHQVLVAVATQCRSKTTRLLEEAEDQQVIPTAWRQHLSGKLRFAVIGTEDSSMGNLLPEDCLVAIDTSQRTIDEVSWKTDAERPIYLVWRNKGNPHVCCWAYQDGNTLTLLPYQARRRRKVTYWKAPTEAQIIGRVVHAWRLPLDVPKVQTTRDENFKVARPDR